MPAFPARNDPAKAALFRAGAILLAILVAALLTACAKVEPIVQNDNASIMIDEPSPIPETEPVIITNEDVSNTVPNEIPNQVEGGNLAR